MESLIRAVGDFLAAVLGAVGFVGRPRRRANIRHDLELLRDLEATSRDFAPGTKPHQELTEHIAREVTTHSDLNQKQRPWGSIVLALAIAVPLAYLAYKLSDDGFSWWSVIPGFVAVLMAISIAGMLNPSEDSKP